MKKTFFIIVILIIIAGGYYFYDQNKKQVMAPTQPESALVPTASPTPTVTATPTPTPTPTAKTNASGGVFSGGEEGGGSDVQVVEVDYTDKGFSPQIISIKVNDWVFFKNNSQTDLWPASGPHPIHTAYPGFDAGKAIAPGKTYKFQFTKAGSWSYHNHLNESQTGTVVVQ